MIRVARSFQITGLDMSGYAIKSNYEPHISGVIKSLLAASSEITWVNLVGFSVEDNLYALDLSALPTTVKYLSVTGTYIYYKFYTSESPNVKIQSGN